MHTGQKIKELRKLKLWTQAELVDRAKVSERTVRRLESSGTAESATLLSVLDALETNLSELDNIVSEDESIKKASTEKHTDVKFLHRIQSGRDLVRIISHAHQYGYDYHDCHTEEQTEVVQVFLTTVADVLDIWDIVEIGQRFDLENNLSKEIKHLEELGLWVFGDRQINKKDNWITAIVEIYSKENPLIQKVKLDKDLMRKNK
ncbi:helix-turn-helix domain-containing protein [Robertmurraya massiliosenegalensis]|uniref:helix-turn-helix domain-containing protein n=1 Tax=Robertmurraya massiliosenegalensis TaxID=1287657 RepID=UPI00031B3052|nr:helix-turn-helix transcriptional regulator [Robertmurraya massiliosenegalensis]